MAVVHLPSVLTAYTGGVAQVSIEAPRVHELLAVLAARFPGLAPQLEGMAMAIDGDVRPDAEYEALLPTSDVYFVPKISGG